VANHLDGGVVSLLPLCWRVEALLGHLQGEDGSGYFVHLCGNRRDGRLDVVDFGLLSAEIGHSGDGHIWLRVGTVVGCICLWGILQPQTMAAAASEQASRYKRPEQYEKWKPPASGGVREKPVETLIVI